jgi:hypothetical protein
MNKVRLKYRICVIASGCMSHTTALFRDRKLQQIRDIIDDECGRDD